MTRWKAASIHLGISALVIASVAALLIVIWFGWDFFPMMGGLKMLTVMVICDLTIGPLLTLIVYKQGKPSLRMDLTVIALLQAGFLAYGLFMVAQTRPVFLVGVLDRFELVFANELAEEDLAKGMKPEYRHRSWSGARVVGGRMAIDQKEYLDLALSGLAGKDIQLMPERYAPYEDVAPALAEQGKPLAELKKDSPPEAIAKLERAVAAAGPGATPQGDGPHK